MKQKRNSILLSFSQKNEDVKSILDNKQESDPNFIRADYICDAIRFYEKYKDKVIGSTALNEDDVKRIVNEILQNNQIEDEDSIETINTELDLNTDYILDSDLEED